MTSYFFKRLGLAGFILLWSALITFAFISILPGDYYTRMKISIAFRPGITRAQVEEEHHTMLERHGLADSWIVQFAKWVWGIVSRGDFGHSFGVPGTPAGRQANLLSHLFRPGGEIANSLLIGGTSMMMAWLLAVPMAIIASVRRGRWINYGLMLIGAPSLAMPGFVLAGLILWFLVVHVDRAYLLPSMWGICGHAYADCPMSWPKLMSCLGHLAPIWFIVGLPVFTVAVRVLRSSLLDTLQMPCIVVARSKGLSSMKIHLKHALRLSLNPLISTIGVTLPTVLVNALLVGFMFGIPTYGFLLKSAIERQDPSLLATMMLFYSFVLIVGNLLADIGLAVADPRIRYD